ncbi:Xaa-Pro aminopeptidase [Aureibacillus halotolerans]|uniref:Xaa-Pro aminopeptidase n=2 Tax=Aureibacillus halotolerans TaxID=1508390 RepID=A0A4R6TR39_9BACI|nr:Xaa-Pro aminopeptidase [Aureibacillus halotolerans]
MAVHKMRIISSLQSKLSAHNLDGILIYAPHNRKYVTKFTGTAGAVLIGESSAFLFTDFRYIAQAEAQVKDCKVVNHGGRLVDSIVEKAAASGITRLGFEENHFTYKQYIELKTAFQDVELIPIGHFVEDLRKIKLPEEIECLQEAARIADVAFNHIQSFIKPGLKEQEIATELERVMKEQGATSAGTPIIVASGWRGALPHGVASEKTVEVNEMITMDFGAYYKDYHSDLTRTVSIGEPQEKLVEIYNIVLEALERTVAALAPGMPLKEADALCRKFIRAEGYGDFFGHGAGHGLGLEIHEEPFLSPKSSGVLEEGMVITVEPGIYLPEIGGVRIEDDLLLTKGGVKRLTTSERQLIRL